MCGTTFEENYIVNITQSSRGGGGGILNILVGVCHGTLKKRGLWNWHNLKGGLRNGHSAKKGYLRNLFCTNIESVPMVLFMLVQMIYRTVGTSGSPPAVWSGRGGGIS